MLVTGGRRLRGLHRNQSGTISILSTFALLMFTMLLLLITNVAMQADDKVKMQNAADSATYSGGIVIARGMNAVAFSNHLETDVLAITAFLREARDRDAEKFVPAILARWDRIGRLFSGARFEKFRPLPSAIPGKTPLEQELVTAWSELAATAAEFALPVFVHILGTPQNIDPMAQDHLIPNFQRDVLRTIPNLAQEVTYEIALRHGLPHRQMRQVTGQVRDNPTQAANGRGPQIGVLWRSSVLPVGLADEENPMTRTLPIIDPDPSQSDYYRVPNGDGYLARSVSVRDRLARHYLELWIDDPRLDRGLGFFGDEAKMSAFQALFRIAACAHLNRLLEEEYPTTNVPMMIREELRPMSAGNYGFNNTILDRDYTYVGVVSRRHVNEMGPLMFRNPMNQQSDATTFAQIRLYIPQQMYRCCPWAWPWYDQNGTLRWTVHTNGWPNSWDLFTQNWMVRLVPTSVETLPDILQANPGGYASNIKPPRLSGATIREIDAVNMH